MSGDIDCRKVINEKRFIQQSPPMAVKMYAVGEDHFGVCRRLYDTNDYGSLLLLVA